MVAPPSWLEHIPFAFWIVDALRPTTFVELGTQSGNSYASFAQAVQMLRLSCACYSVDTWRGDSQSGFYDEDVFTDWSSYHDRHFSAFSRLVRSTFSDAARHFLDGSIDLLHSDGCHTYEAACADFETWRPKLSRRGVILFHDINVREGDFGVWRLWEELKSQSPSFEFLHGHGLGVLAAGPDVPEPLKWLFTVSSCADATSVVREFFARLGGVIASRFVANENADASRQQRDAAILQLTGDRNEQDATISRLTTERSELDATITKLTTERTAQDETVSRLSDELTLSRDRNAAIAADLQTEAARSALNGERILRLEDQLNVQRAELRRELGRHKRQTIEIGELLRNELERRRQVEAERDKLMLAASAERPPEHQAGIRRIDAAWRGSARYLRSIVMTPAALGLVPGRGRHPFGALGAFLSDPARLRDACIVLASGLFDERYYLQSYPDVARSRLAPLAHFVIKGASERRNPHPLFDTTYYLRCNPDVAAAGLNPLVHYRLHGVLERRNPHPLFDTQHYLEHNPDVRNAGIEPLGHFCRSGGVEGRNPNPFFDSTYYLQTNPDVAHGGANPLLHFHLYGWREGRRPSPSFDPMFYLSRNGDVRALQSDPLEHYLEYGRAEGRAAVAPFAQRDMGDEGGAQPPEVTLRLNRLGGATTEKPTVLCLSHVMPWPPRAGNEYRIYRMLCWLRDQGYRIVPVIAPLPGDRIDADAVRALADQFSNAVLCHRDGRVEYVLRDVPDVLSSLHGEPTRQVAALLDEHSVRDTRERELLHMDRTFCHDAAITTVLRLQSVLGPHVFLAEYIWMCRIMPLIAGDVFKVVDTIDVFSTKQEKVLQFGIDDIHIEPNDEARRLCDSDLVLAIQEDERGKLQRLLPAKRVVTVGVDFDVIDGGGAPSGRCILYIASDNPLNKKGLRDFLRFAWPHIRQEVPDAELLLAGSVGQILGDEIPGVVRLGHVVDLRPFYERARLMINPAVAGTGLKIKTLEALSHLRPIVTWPNGAEGLPLELAGLCIVVRDWYEFTRGVMKLLAAETPRIFSAGERELVIRLTSPAVAYGAMSAEMAAYFERTHELRR